MKRLKKTLDFQLKLPKTKISKVLDNPKDWAESLAEKYLLQEAFRIIESKKLGQDFAKSLDKDSDV